MDGLDGLWATRVLVVEAPRAAIDAADSPNFASPDGVWILSWPAAAWHVGGAAKFGEGLFLFPAAPSWKSHHITHHSKLGRPQAALISDTTTAGVRVLVSARQDRRCIGWEPGVLPRVDANRY